MRLYLAKTLEGLNMYGPIYDLGSGVPDKVEDCVLGYAEQEWFLDNLVDEINAACDTLLDDGDVDFFDVEKCNKLISTLSDIREIKVPEYCEYMIDKLREYAVDAINYNTGIAIEL